MTRPSKEEPDGLDTAIDHTIDRLTAVDDWAVRSLAQTQRRLLAAGPRADIRRRRGRVRRTWVAATTCVALLLVLGVIWLTNRPGPVPQSAGGKAPDQDLSRSARATDARPPLVGEPRVAIANGAGPTASAERRTASTSRRESRRLPSPTARAPVTDRLATFLLAVQQLPPDVWERLDAAGPPTVPSLDIGEVHPIAPLAVEQLPGTEWPTDGPNDDNPPGGSR